LVELESELASGFNIEYFGVEFAERSMIYDTVVVIFRNLLYS